MESVPITTTTVSYFGYVYECMRSWIKCPPPSCIYDPLIFGKSILSIEELLPSPGSLKYEQFDFLTFIKLIDVFDPLLYVPYNIAIIFFIVFLLLI